MPGAQFLHDDIAEPRLVYPRVGGGEPVDPPFHLTVLVAILLPGLHVLHNAGELGYLLR